jgi:hypothetical protein
MMMMMATTIIMMKTMIVNDDDDDEEMNEMMFIYLFSFRLSAVKGPINRRRSIHDRYNKIFINFLNRYTE